ncbi:ester cyclase [Nitrospirillum sp. BR 11164]|uniref:ester cyclase n=1 Tax=Nitrospirillum sp. BR 11164 TaxID=3104324 RepID=UPI002AFE2AC8|nr:ester cyclase [Nitrospirillum sp. BR 11164]MEA1649776.1 ester cyclase [Nitrospirillum sp. BR 11164]
MPLSVMRGTVLAFALTASPLALAAGADTLVQPKHVTVDASLPKAQADAEILAALRYATFWSTGDEALAHAALAPHFTDRTLPPGRAQGVPGPLAASAFVRAAIPDLTASVEQLVVAGDRVTVHFRFQGHFTGHFGDVQGKGQTVDFIATDLYRVQDGRIAENWHIEDNLTLLRQLGVVAQ